MTAQHINEDTDLADVTVSGPDGSSVLHTTQHHPFWNVTRQQWTDASDLRAGDELRTAEDQPGTVVVAAVAVFDVRNEMRDLTVANIHTYYVLAGNTPVLVHNCGSGAITQKAMDEHIVARHFQGAPEAFTTWAGKSKFQDWVTQDMVRNWSKLAMRKPSGE